MAQKKAFFKEDLNTNSRSRALVVFNEMKAVEFTGKTKWSPDSSGYISDMMKLICDIILLESSESQCSLSE